MRSDFSSTKPDTCNNILVEFGVKYRKQREKKKITKPPAENKSNISGTTEPI